MSTQPPTDLLQTLSTQLAQTNQLLKALNSTMWSLTGAINANTQEEQALVSTLDDLTSIATELGADDSALTTAVNNLVTAFEAAKAGGFTAAQQAQLDAAVTALSGAHADLAADAKAAVAAVTPAPTTPPPSV